MALEIERKFLVDEDKILFVDIDHVEHIWQGYLSNGVRVRISDSNEGCKAFITDKQGQGLIRTEYESEIHPAIAERMKMLAVKSLEKTRTRIGRWEVDDFGDFKIAEIELDSLDEEISLPEWVGKEVTDDPKYLNKNLAK